MFALQQKRTVVDKLDDFDGTPGAETVAFSFEGVSYEMELSEPNLKEMRELLAPYIDRARRKRGGSRAKHVAVKPTSKQVREWAAANDIDCPRTGRVPADVMEQYKQAN